MRSSSTRYAIALAFAAGLSVLLAASPAHADRAAEFKVIVVKATNDGNSIDPELQPHADLLQGKGYTNFEKVRSKGFTLNKGQSESVSVGKNLKAKFTYKSEVNERIAFKYEIIAGGKAKPAVHYAIPRGSKTALIIPLGKYAFILIIKVS